ncbi:DUF1295 domain-containing protein [Nitrospira sp. M1]
MSFLSLSFDFLLIVWLSGAIVMLGLWCFYCFHRNAVLADVGFCLLFGVLSIVSVNLLPGDILRKGLVGAMGAVYAFRLAGHLCVHRIYGKFEDARYQTLRNNMGRWAPLGFFVYFQGQALAVVIFFIPLFVLMSNPYPPFAIGEILGMMLWIFAMTGEALADSQLAKFRQIPENAGKIYRDGFWRYSRHPNYFFEGMIWTSYVVMAIGVPYGGLTLIGPVLMITALLKVSGIPYAEAQALSTRGEEYREYQRTTSTFVPWFPKK